MRLRNRAQDESAWGHFIVDGAGAICINLLLDGSTLLLFRSSRGSTESRSRTPEPMISLHAVQLASIFALVNNL